MTASGLARRTPTTPAVGSPAGPGPNAGHADQSVTRTSRSPEEVRRMLSRYRSGLSKGRDGCRATEPADAGARQEERG